MRKALEIHPCECQQSNSCKIPVKMFELLAGTATKEGAASPLLGSLGSFLLNPDKGGTAWTVKCLWHALSY